jgi:hypothetical protein
VVNLTVEIFEEELRLTEDGERRDNQNPETTATTTIPMSTEGVNDGSEGLLAGN